MSARMNPEVKARWVAALRSGEYKQGTGHLNSQGAHCCLGVLCDLHAKQTGGQWDAPSYRSGGARYDGLSMGFPATVVDWAGLDDSAHGAGPELVIARAQLTAAAHNDRGRTFAELADAIEAQL
jgi:hypothetical protein